MGVAKSRFQVLKEGFGVYFLYKLYDSNTGEYASILPYLGGTLGEVVFKINGRLVCITDGYKSFDDAKNNLSSYKGSILFPFPNRICDGKYNYDGKLYQLPINIIPENNSLHGLVCDKEFQVSEIREQEDGCSLILTYSPHYSIPGYPFNYLLEVEYKWTVKNHFECTTRFTNKSEVSIPVGDGWHPYFKAGEADVNDLWIRFPAKENLELDNRQIPTGKSKPYSVFEQLTRIGDASFDSCFTLKADVSPAEILILNKKEDIGYKVWQETGNRKYNYLQIYTPPGRNSIAIEPMTCAPDAFNNKMGLIILNPQETIIVTWGITSLIS